MSRFGIGLSFVLCVCAASVSPGSDASEIDAAVRAAVASGPARVIVELRLPFDFRPEGELSDQGAREQRRAIAAAQEQITTQLSGTQFRVVRRQSTVPFVALEIGADALARLERMTELVARVFEDKTLSVQ